MSAELQSSRLPHREVAAGLLRPTFEWGTMQPIRDLEKILGRKGGDVTELSDTLASTRNESNAVSASKCARSARAHRRHSTADHPTAAAPHTIAATVTAGRIVRRWSQTTPILRAARAAAFITARTGVAELLQLGFARSCAAARDTPECDARLLLLLMLLPMLMQPNNTAHGRCYGGALADDRRSNSRLHLEVVVFSAAYIEL